MDRFVMAGDRLVCRENEPCAGFWLGCEVRGSGWRHHMRLDGLLCHIDISNEEHGTILGLTLRCEIVFQIIDGHPKIERVG